MNAHSVIVTDFGEVAIGPKFQRLVDGVTPDLTRRKNSKAFKSAQLRLNRLETAVSVMSEAEFLAGGVLKATP